MGSLGPMGEEVGEEYVGDFFLLLFVLIKFLSLEERPKFSTNESKEGKASSMTSFCALEWDMEVDLCLGLVLGFCLGLAEGIEVPAAAATLVVPVIVTF